MKARFITSPVPSVDHSKTLRSLASFCLLTIVVAIPVFAQEPHTAGPTAEERARNVTYIHPPEAAITPAVRPVADASHPPPLPNAKPKSPAAKPVDRGPLPAQMPPNMEKENPDNLIRNWKNQRPIEERRRAVEESLAMPAEPHRAKLEAHTPGAESSSTLTTTGWEQVGTGDWNSDGVHYEAGRIRQASYAYDNSQNSDVLWLGSTGGGLWKAVDFIFFAVFVPVSDNLPGSPSVGAFLVQPGNSNNILIGTGDSYRYGGTGMFRTTDGGTTWNAVYPTDGTSWPSAFQKVLIDLSDSSNQTVLAEGDSGIWRSTDFGDTWTRVYNGATSDLVQDPVHT